MERIILFLILAFVSVNGQAQYADDLPAVIGNMMLGEQLEEEHAGILENLTTLFEQPLDLNNAREEELKFLGLSQEQSDNLLRHISQYGQLASLFELQLVEGFDLELIDKIAPFVRVDNAVYTDKPWLKTIFDDKNNYYFQRWEINTTAMAQVSEYKVLTRFRSSKKDNYSMGITMEKDAGEKFAWNPHLKSYGFDFYSFHFSLYNRGRIKQLTLGDFSAQFGEGLIFSAGFSLGKSYETILTVKRVVEGVRPFTSATEAGYFRGGSLTYNLSKRLDLTLIASADQRDAVVKEGVDGLYFGSINNTGYHRTESEMSSKNRIWVMDGGSVLQYSGGRIPLQFGAMLLYSFFEHPRILENKPKYYYEFQGSENWASGFYANYRWRNTLWFHESGLSNFKNPGMLTGTLINLSADLELSLIYRYYSRGFTSFYGRAFGELSRNINEKGIYTGIKYSISKYATLYSYIDRFRFPWLRHNVNSPDAGYEYLMGLVMRPVKKVNVNMRWRKEEKGRNTDGGPLHQVRGVVKNNYLMGISIDVHSKLVMKSRLQGSITHADNQRSTGFLIAQDLNFNGGKIGLSARVQLFSTGDYANRQYIYERAPMYAMALPAFQGEGTRKYILLRYKMNNKMDCWIKVAQTLALNPLKAGDTENASANLNFQWRYKI